MASKVGIVNLALGHLAVGKEIANLETEKSEEARAGRRFYDVALKVVLRDFPWPFATRITALALVEEEPNTEWGYSYRYPSDCLYFRRILSGLRNDSRQSRAPYRVARDASGLLIFTDQQDAEAEYTILANAPQFYPPDFELALSYYLASLMAPHVTGGDHFKLGERALQLYSLHLSTAQSNAGNEEQAEEEPEAESIRARE